MPGDELQQFQPQLFDMATAGANGFRRRGIVEQCQQQVLDGDEFMTLLPRLDKGQVQADFQFLRNHSVFLHHAGQRMLVLTCIGHHLGHFGRGDVAWIRATNAAPFHMDFEHDLRCPFLIHGKKLLQHMNDKIHWREVVVEQNDGIQRRRRELCAAGFKNGSGLLLLAHVGILA